MKVRIIIWIVLLLCVCGAVFTCSTTQHKLENANRENAELQEQYLSAAQDAMAIKYDLVKLRLANDSTIKELLKTKDEIKIKDKKIKYLLSNKETIYVNDTAYFVLHDTLNVPIYCDTTFGDSIWYSTHLHIDSVKAAVATTMTSQQNVVIYQTKEYIDPDPCWLKRLFQRKKTITRVHIKELNPYIIADSTERVFIEQ